MRRPVFALPVRLLLLLVLMGLPLSSARASSIASPHNPSRFDYWMNAPSYLHTNISPSSPDNWLGGTGYWDVVTNWSAGEPGSNSDVFITTGNDTVNLDVNAGINSLTIGNGTGSSTLQETMGRGLAISIAGALTINQGGTLSLANDSVTANANSSNAGTITLSNSSALISNAGFVNTGTIQLNGGIQRPGIGVAGSLTNSGLILDNSQSAFVNVGGTVNNSGGIFIYYLSSGSALTNTASGSLNAQYLSVNGDMVNAGTVYGLGRGSQMTIQGMLTNSGRFDTSYATANVGSLNNSGNLIVGGTMTVHGNAYNSGEIGEGYIGPSNGQSFVVNGTFTNAPTGNVQMTGPYIGGASAGSIVNQGTIDMEYNAPLSAGSLTNSGTIETGMHSGSNSISVTGTLTNNASGVLSLGGMSDVSSFAYVNNAGSVSIANGAALHITGGSHATANAFPGFINSGSVLVAQGGTLTSPLTYTQTSGQTTVDGLLALTGNGFANFSGGSVYGNGGTIQGNTISNAAFNIGDAPMSVGQMAINGNYTQGANGSLTFDIASLTQYDQLNVSGHATLNGLVMVDLLNGYVPQIGNTFDVMNFAGSSGTFSMVIGLPINSQEHFVLEYNSTDLTLNVVAGATAPTISGHGDGYVNGYYEPYVSEVTQRASPADFAGSVPSASVPEPGSMVLLSSGILGIAGLRRRLMV
jgi:PEP-CTERM motif